jgi:hypothetical protein
VSWRVFDFFDAKLLFPIVVNSKQLTLPIFFTPSHANEVLPEVRSIVQQVIAIKKDVDSVKDDDEMTDAMERMEKEIKKLEEMGCILKDMSIGLIDFPAVRLGERVWLCWKLGEEKVAFWHTRNEGFAGRKPVVETEFYDDDLAIRSLTGEIVSKTRT